MYSVASYLLRCFIVVNSPPIKEKSKTGHWDANTLGVGLLQFSHLCRHLDPEVDFVGVLPNHFELDVLGGSVISGLHKMVENNETTKKEFTEKVVLTFSDMLA